MKAQLNLTRGLKNNIVLLIVVVVSVAPFIANLLGFDFASQAISLESVKSAVADVTKDEQFHALKGALHHALLEWSAVSIAVIAALISFLHYSKNGDVSVPIIGMAMLCAGFTDAFHTLAATRIIAANAPNTDFIPFTWAFSRIFNATVMVIGLSISLWLQNNIRQRGFFNSHKKTQRNLKLLILVSMVFVSFAVVSVIVAAGSDSLPKTMFVNALIKRPYDVLPLALFLFSGALVWSWYKVDPTPLKLAILFSIIPEVATQMHMSFGSTQLFDNHFNIAHGLKIVAYICILSGLLVSMMSGERSQFDSEAVEKSKVKAFKNPPVKLSGLLKIGNAKYPQSFIIPAGIFILMLSVTALISSVYYVETERFLIEEQKSSYRIKTKVLSNYILAFYERVNRDIQFLSKTPPIQGIIQSIETKDKQNEKLWVGRLEVILKGMLETDQDYLQIKYISAKKNSGELVDVYRIDNVVEVMPNSHLDAFAFDATLEDVLTHVPGETIYSDVLIKQLIHGKEVNLLRVATPIYDEKESRPYAIIEIDIDFTKFIAKLARLKLGNMVFYLGNSQSNIIYQSSRKADVSFSKIDTLFDSFEQKNVIYQEILLMPFTSKQVIKTVIKIEDLVLENKLNQIRYSSLLLGFGLSVVALTLGVFVSRKIVGPMTQMTKALEVLTYTGQVGSLPIKSQDEMGVLAREFHNMLITKEAKDKELIEQKFAMDQHVIVSTTNVKGEITYVNESFCEISGYSSEELIGQDHRLLNSGFHGIIFFKEMYQTLIKGEVWENEICNRAKNGHVYWVLTTIVPFMNEQGKPISYISMRTDISASKKNSKELSLARDDLSYKVAKLQQANADLDQFAYVASHDLKSPLNGINQLVSWIEEDCAELLPEESKEHLGLLKSRSKRMLNLLNDLLDYSRIGRDKHEVEPIILQTLVNDVFDLQSHTDGFNCTAPERKIVLQRIPFEMVMRNLISNAVKHHDKNEGDIMVSLKRDNGFYEITVKDDGPGIPPELHEKALEMFQTLKSRDEVEGSGMGMAMVKKMIEHHGGTMKIDSPGGRGTAIILTWPTPLRQS